MSVKRAGGMGMSRTVFDRLRRRLEPFGSDGVHPKRQRARRGRPPAVPGQTERGVIALALEDAAARLGNLALGDLVFTAPKHVEGRHVGSEFRHDLLLFFKEAVNNAARHARSGRVEIELRVERGSLVLRVIDDGDRLRSRRTRGWPRVEQHAPAGSAHGRETRYRLSRGCGTRLTLTLPLR